MRKLFPVRDYNLAVTLTSGQAFRWQPAGDGWEGVVAQRWVRLRPIRDGLEAEAATPVDDWRWLTDYLQLDGDLRAVVKSFPSDPVMDAALGTCRGLRLLKQEPWECLASFLLSSTKRITQIQRVIALVCERFGSPLAVPAGHTPVHGFPLPERMAAGTEKDLRGCQMGFRAPFLKAAAERIVSGDLQLERIATMELAPAREELMRLAGVGPKIANCVLLFAYGKPKAFPVDVWILNGLRRHYFNGRRRSPAQLSRWAEEYFGPNAGYAQQYLFHHLRTQTPR